LTVLLKEHDQAEPRPDARRAARRSSTAARFANIAHGNNSLVADPRRTESSADYVVTESGFRLRTWAWKKFFDIVCRAGGADPEARACSSPP